VIELRAAFLEHRRNHPSIGRIRGPNSESKIAIRRRAAAAAAAAAAASEVDGLPQN
jgi:hypothetical protein